MSRVVAHNTHYAVSLDHLENGQASEAFCGKLRCNSKGTEFAIYDDSNDPYGLKTGKPRRELGIISYKKKLLGPTELIVVMPRVRKDGACAQFRPSQPEESMIQLFKAGRVEHMFILRGTANVAPGGVVELFHGGSPQSGQGKVVLSCYGALDRFYGPTGIFAPGGTAAFEGHMEVRRGMRCPPCAAIAHRPRRPGPMKMGPLSMLM